MAKKEIVVSESMDLTAYDVLQDGVDSILPMIQANVGTMELSEFNLIRAINPAAGTNRWKIPGLGDEEEFVGEVEGIIVYHKVARLMYEKSYDETGGGVAPVCKCIDGIGLRGEGDPGGLCSPCPFSKFTKDEDGNAVRPKCRYVKQLFILRPGEIMPTLFNATSGNARFVEDYLFQLTIKARLPFNHCVTRIKLVEDTTKQSKQKYAKWVLSLVSPLPAEAREQMDSFNQFLEPILSQVEATDEDIMQEPEF